MFSCCLSSKEIQQLNFLYKLSHLSLMRCLIIDDMHESIHALLQSAGCQPDYQPHITREQILPILPEYEGLIVRSKTPIDAALLQHATQLKFIGRAGAGLDNIDVQTVEQKGIKLFHAAAGNRDAVGEHAVGMLLSILNKLHSAHPQVQQKKWLREYNRGHELGSRVVGIIGYGNMGQSFAKKLRGFGCEIIAYDKYLETWPNDIAERVSLEELQQRADVLSLHIPLTPETKQMVDLPFLQAFVQPIWFVNTARGEIVKLADLCQVLHSGQVRTAALDVLENEKLQTLTAEQTQVFEELAAMENVLFSPHVAGWTVESYERINEVLAAQIKAFVTK
jgi:D-3-phosphoglycerate dehydrogenase